MPTLRNLEENLKKKPIKLQLGNPEMAQGEGVKRRGRPKKLPQADPDKLLKGLDKRLKAKQLAEEKKALKELKAPKKAKEVARDAPSNVILPSTYKPSTTQTITMESPLTQASAPKRKMKPKALTAFMDSPVYQPAKKGNTPIQGKPRKQPFAHQAHTPPVQSGLKSRKASKSQLEKAVSKISYLEDNPFLKELTERELDEADKRIADIIEEGKNERRVKRKGKIALQELSTVQLKPTKRKPLPAPVLAEVTKPKKLTPVGKRKTKAEKEAQKPATQQAQEAIEAVKKAMKPKVILKETGEVVKPKKKFEINPPEASPLEAIEEEDEPVAELPAKKVLVVERDWALNHPEAMAEKPPDKGSRGNKVIAPELINWYKKYPEAPQSIKWMKTTVSGQTYLAEHPEFTFQKGKAGRPTKAELTERDKLKAKKSSAPAQTEAVKAYEERHTPVKPTSPATSAERKEASKEGVKAFAKSISQALVAPGPSTSAPKKGLLASAKKRLVSNPTEEEPPSREIPVAEDAKATKVKAEASKPFSVGKTGHRGHFEYLVGQYGKEQAEQEYQRKYNPDTRTGLELLMDASHPNPMTIDEIIARNESSGEGFRSLSEQMKHHPKMKSLEEFANHIVSNPQKFHKTAVKRAKFYNNVGKGVLNEESDSDKDSSDSDVSDSGEEDESVINIKQCFNKGSGINISHNTIMSRVVGLHPALESSTMTMNPGAYNNIKPLMGHLMGGAVSSHIRRSEHMGRTMSHYGDHHSHPQMMPMGHYTKHMKKGGPVMPTMDDLLHHGVEHLKTKFGTAPDHAHKLLHTALHTASIPKELHPMAHYGLTKGLKSLVSMMGGSIGGSFWTDLGSKLGHAFTGVGDVAKDIVQGRDLKDSFSEIGDIAKDTAYSVGDDIKREAPGLLKQTNEIYNDPRTQTGIRLASTALNEAGMPYLGMPLSVANVGVSNALDAGANNRDVMGQLDNRYISPAKRFLQRLGIKGLGVGDGLYAQGGKVGTNLSKNLASNVGRLADSGSNYLIRQMGEDPNAGGKVGRNLAKNLAKNVGRLADSGSDYLIRQMDGHGFEEKIEKSANKKRLFSEKGGKVGTNLSKNLASNVGRLADSGSNYLIRQMGEDPNAGGKVGRNLAKKLAKNTEKLADKGTDYLIKQMGGEIGDGLYAQGRGVRPAKGSQEAKDHMAKLRAMRGGSVKAQKGSAMPEEDKPSLGKAGKQLKAQQSARRHEEQLQKQQNEQERQEGLIRLDEGPIEKHHRSVKKGKGIKKMKGGAMPPPSRSPVTNPIIAGGLYA